MPVRERRFGDDQPLFKAVGEQQLLIRPAGPEQAETAQATDQEAPREATQGQSAPQTQETGQGEKGPIAGALDRAEANNWVYGSVANMLRQTGLIAKADKLLSKSSGR
ncbi:MAG: hypothetical protein M3Q60_06450 [Actinomycetota bacterium]|nr:hypothetical protein [Actinomycetota bacterium]